MVAHTKFLTAGPMARRLRVPVRWLRGEEPEAGRIPHVPAGKVLLFDPETVEQVLLERARQRREGVHCDS
jgi:hypothetical protein